MNECELVIATSDTRVIACGILTCAADEVSVETFIRACGDGIRMLFIAAFEGIWVHELLVLWRSFIFLTGGLCFSRVSDSCFCLVLGF